ncbi:MAG: RNA ligase RtcB family protein [Clostridiales Family XIII bacterium]|nr:RNA ligase RtcB family protein [Clostridiales Family XIII bacterium]
MDKKITLITNEKCWMEQDARTQLEGLAALPGVVRVVGLPDLHPGKTPVGVAAETKEIIYPHLLGSDIGCGMSLFVTGCSVKKYKKERFFAKLYGVRSLRDVDVGNPYPEESPIEDLGTIGGGNHFAEFQKLEDIRDEDACRALGLGKENLLLLVHSGSRGYGKRIMDAFSDYGGLEANGERAAAYLAAHDDALLWAERNRFVVARKLMHVLGFAPETETVIDCPHNFLQRHNGVYIHRKGATGALGGPVVIPGSRGAFSYIVAPGEHTAFAAHSLAHGAGRKWMRSQCKGRLKNKYGRDAIAETRLGSKSVCHDADLLYEEAPEAYKPIEHVIDAMVQSGLCRVIATLRPLLTVKL